MLYKVSLLCFIIFVVVAGVPEPDKVKGCRAIGGRCIKAADCPKQDVLRNACNRGRRDGSRVCCAVEKQKRVNGVKKRKSKGCEQKPSCRKTGGLCIGANQKCLGRVKEGACKKGNCKCCILIGGDRTETKRRGDKKKKNIHTENKNDEGCKKKKTCKGFCVGENVECLGESDPKGCKGKKCSCCTLRDKKEEKSNATSSGDYDVDYEPDYTSPGSSGYYENNYGSSGSGNYYSGEYDPYEYEYSGSGNYYSGEYDPYEYESSGDYHDDKCFNRHINSGCEDDGCGICGDGQCYPASQKCDKNKDCDDGSDELGCPQPPKHVPGSCPREYNWVLSSCYKVVALPSSSWSDARKVCQAVNGDLALIYDHTLFTAYMKAFHDIEQAVYWVGIHRDNGTYTWVNGTILPENSSLWGSTEDSVLGNDDEDCVVLNFNENRLQPTSCGVNTYNNKFISSICEYVDNDYHG